MTDLTKTEKTLSFVKSYIYPFIVIIIGLAIGWSALDNTVHANSKEIVKLELSCDDNEKVIGLILQRLSSIDTKLDFIVKEIDSIK